MKKLIINHFVEDPQFSNGVSNYIKELNSLLERGYDVLSKPYKMGMEDFRRYVFNVLEKQGTEYYSVIECAESQSPSLYLSRRYNVHIRMHCPYFLYKKVIMESPDEARFSDEVRAMYKAKAVSSPSYGMLSLLENELDIDHIHVYKNPIKKQAAYYKKRKDRDIDVIFLSRFNNLKGNDFIDPLIKKLPNNINIVIAGKQEEKIYLSEEYPNVLILNHIEGNEKFEYLSRAKVAISLSKFENCSMAILEALSVGTPVVAWDVGGNKEMAPPPILTVVPLANINAFAKSILMQLNKDLCYEEFETVIDALNEDFMTGLSHVEKFIQGEVSTIYKGISYATTHDAQVIDEDYVDDSSLSYMQPLKVLCFTATLAASRFFHRNFNTPNQFVSCEIAYQGAYYSEIRSICKYQMPINFSSIVDLEKVIKQSKPDVVIFSNDYPIHINDIYYLRKNFNLFIGYSEPSRITPHDYTLDFYGFNKLSSIYFNKIKSEPKLISVTGKKIIFWALYVESLKNIDIDRLMDIVNEYTSIDFVGSSDLLDELIEITDCHFNVIKESNVEYGAYDIIVTGTDMFISRFFPFENKLLLVNKDSIFDNKNIKGYLYEEKVDIGSRFATQDFFERYSILKNSKNILGTIRQVLHKRGI